jgi:hypothetical protein
MTRLSKILIRINFPTWTWLVCEEDVIFGSEEEATLMNFSRGEVRVACCCESKDEAT